MENEKKVIVVEIESDYTLKVHHVRVKCDYEPRPDMEACGFMGLRTVNSDPDAAKFVAVCVSEILAEM